jgi:hypothetical protein
VSAIFIRIAKSNRNLIVKKISILAILVLGAFSTMAQITDITEEFILPPILKESSGVIFFNGKLISHNDSGNQNVLYELDPVSGMVTRTITIDNAVNVDWEDISQDSTSIYIGDIGNNNGNRTDLKIYKINKTDYLNATTVTAEIIYFNYSDQTDFTSNPNNTEWDSEALINFDTALILLTKNWVTGITKAYPIPKNSGNYSASPLPTPLNSQGLITGATFNESTGKLYSVGYSLLLQPFVWISEGFSGNDIFSGTNTQIPLASLGLEQIEAITHTEPNKYFMTSESFNIVSLSEDAKLISFSTNDAVSSVEETPFGNLKIYPNPVEDILIIDGWEFNSIEIYDMNSRLVHKGNSQEVNMSQLVRGVYYIKISLANHAFIIKKIIKI